MQSFKLFFNFQLIFCNTVSMHLWGEFFRVIVLYRLFLQKRRENWVLGWVFFLVFLVLPPWDVFRTSSKTFAIAPFHVLAALWIRPLPPQNLLKVCFYNRWPMTHCDWVTKLLWENKRTSTSHFLKVGLSSKNPENVFNYLYYLELDCSHP